MLGQTDTASGSVRAVVRTGAGVGVLEVRPNIRLRPSDPRAVRRIRRETRAIGAHSESGIWLFHGSVPATNFAVTSALAYRALSGGSRPNWTRETEPVNRASVS